MAVVTEIATLDGLLHGHADVLGGDFAAYRNHTYLRQLLAV
jgi:hypothetical protein